MRRVQIFRPFREAAGHRTDPAVRGRLLAAVRSGPLRDRMAVMVATTMLTGLLPRPGWVGGLAGTLACALLPLPARWAALAAWTGAGLASVAIAGRMAGSHDPPEFNVDEVVGAWLAAAVCGAEGWSLLLPYSLFSLFDFVKPVPANLLDRRGDAFGVIGDDVAAGLWAGALAALILAIP